MILTEPAASGVVSDLSDYQTVAAILELHPLLSWRGWWSNHYEVSEPVGTLARVRRETLDEYGLAQFRRAMAFLEAAPRIQSVNRRHCCYGWKHAAERWTRSTNGGRYADYYIGEGSFIAACIESGMQIHRERLGTYTNLSMKAWEMGERTL
jgi:hypothetical protein